MSNVFHQPAPHRMTPHRPVPLRAVRAFTLIEILVVIVIIGILVSISLVVGKQVRTGSQSRSTEDTIRILDQSLVGYEKTSSELPPSKFVYRDVKVSPKAYEYPFVDGRYDEANNFDRDANPAVPTLARYTALCSTVPEADSLIQSVNSKLVRRVEIDATKKFSPQPVAVEILDAFGRPIRFVHPAFDGGYGIAYDPAQITSRDLNRTAVVDSTSNSDPKNVYRRSARPFDPAQPQTGTRVGDGDEGICPSRRPYFYSAGPDGDPGTRSNNVYTTRPTYPTETAKIK